MTAGALDPDRHLLNLGDNEAESPVVAWRHEHGLPTNPDAGTVRIAGIEWLDSALCARDGDPGAWRLDPSEMVGEPPVLVRLSLVDRTRSNLARLTCGVCPVSTQCAALAAESAIVPVGIWAGLDWAERGGKVFSDEAERKAVARRKETPEARAARNERRAVARSNEAPEVKAERQRKDREARRLARAK